MVKDIAIRLQTEQFEMPAACRERSGTWSRLCEKF